MNRPATVIMLAGSLRPSPLVEQLGIPAICLPIDQSTSLLEAWLEAIEEVIPTPEVRVVVNGDQEADAIRACVARSAAGPTGSVRVEIMTDPAPVRGTGGVLRDVAADLPSDRLLMVIEGSCVPNGRLSPLFEALDAGIDGVVGATSRGEPAGVYLFEHAALSSVPHLGYHDLKEQLLPALYDQGRAVRLAEIADRVVRVRDRESYLDAVRMKLGGVGELEQSVPAHDPASSGPAARLVGSCLVQAGAFVGDGALVHDSVVFAGAVIERRAVVSRSVVGPGVAVAAEGRVVGQILTHTESVVGHGVRAGNR